MPATIDIISRDQQVRQSISAPRGVVVLPLDTSSVVRVHEPADSVVSYTRQGDDLLIQQDTGTLQLTQFFVVDAQGQTSDLVLGGTLQTATHVTFSQAQAQPATASDDEAVVLTPQLAALPEALAQTLTNASSEELAEEQGGEPSDAQVSALQADAPVLLADEAPRLSIDAPLAGDDVISAAEYGQALEITGSTTGLQEDDVVLVALNGKTYSTAVEADGSWKVVVLAEDMLAVPAGVAGIVATAESASGTVVQDNHSVFVITGGVQVTIDELAGDGLLNAAEAQMPLSVTGSVNNAAEGDEVVVSVLDREYLGVVDAQGQWSVEVPADIWQRLTDGDISVTATVTNAGGNSGSATREMTLDTQMPTIAINTLAEDDIVNAVEHGQALEVSGTTTGLQGGEVVRVELDGQTYTSTVSASGEWSVVVRAGDVAALSDGEHTLTATVESHAGNPASGEHTMVVNTVTPTVTVNTPLAGDNVIDATELAQSLEISGTSTGLDAGSIVTIAIGERIYTSEVEADGSWFLGISRLEVSTFEDGLTLVSVSAENPVGNRTEATSYVLVDSTKGANFVVIDPVTGDDQINAAEAAGELAITGTTELAPAGAVVTVTIDGKSYTGNVAADGSWSVPVSADAWAELADGNVTVTAEVSSAGSSGSATRDVLLDTAAPTVALNPLAGDDIINAAEQQQALGVSGTTTGLAGGEVVTVALNGKSYTTTVNADGSWELYIGAKDVTALADGEHTVTASVSDTAGNPASIERNVSVAASGLPVLSINAPLAGDDVINAAEQNQPLEISGTSTGIVAGELVNISLNGKDYSATVEADGSWTLNVPAVDVVTLPEGNVVVAASATDSVGNVAEASHQVTVDTSAPTITIDPISGDGVINAEEASTGVPISGTAEPGVDVVVQVDGNEYTVTAGSDSTWSVMVPAEVWEGLPEGEVKVSATATDSAGNSSDAERSALLNTIPSLTIDGFIDDVGANQGEITNSGALTDDATPTLFGSLSTPLPEGFSLVVYSRSTGDYVGEFSDLDRDAFQITDTSWSYVLPAEYALTNGVHDLEVWIWNGHATDGNFHVATSNAFSIHVDSEADTLPTLSINLPLAGDDMINAVEHDQPLEITGTSTKLDDGDVVRVTLNGKDYAAIVTADGSWALSVPAADVSTLPEGKAVITASATDNVGNVAEASHQVTVDTHPPAKIANITGITDDTGVAGDFITSDTMPVISGGTNGAPYPQMRIEVSLDGGKTWQGGIKPDSNGYWQYAVEQELADGEYDVMARLVDPAGNASRADSITMTIDTAAPAVTVTIDSISEDTGQSATDFLTNDTSPTLHGSLSEALAAGETLQVSVDGGETWTAAAVDGTRWSYVDGRVLSDGQHTYQTRLVDAAENISAGASKTITIDTTSPSKVANIKAITDDTGAAGDFVTSDTMLVISGGTNGAPYPNMRVEVSLDGGETWHMATTPKGTLGSWEYTVEHELADGEYEVMARLVDPAGNASRADTVTMVVDTNAPMIAINALADDDIVNASEHGQVLVVSGTTKGLDGGETIQVTLNDKTYTTAVASNGSWTLNVPASDVSVLADGDYSVEASVADTAGNPASAERGLTVVAASDGAALSIASPLAGDDVINASEYEQPLTIMGGSSGLAVGTGVTVVLNGKSYTAQVAVDGHWSLQVPAADVATLPEGAAVIKASATNAIGNLIEASHQVTVDTAPPSAGIKFTAISDDTGVVGDFITSDTSLTIHLTTTGNSLLPSNRLQVSLDGGKTWNDAQRDGTWDWSYTPGQTLADGQYDVMARTIDAAGNIGKMASQVLVVDTKAPTISINALAGDDAINAAEHGQALVVSGTTSGLGGGEEVQVTLNGKSYTASVAANGNWTLNVPTGDISALGNGSYTVAATVQDAAGNQAAAERQVSVNASTLTIDVVAGDDIIDAQEAAASVTISGDSTGLAAGSKIAVSVAGESSQLPFTAETQADGSWQINLSANDIARLGDGTYVVQASSSAAGIMAERTVQVDTTPAPALTLDVVAGDDIIDAQEAAASVTISGDSTGLAAGSKIAVSVAGESSQLPFTAEIQADGSWQINLSANDIARLGDGTYVVQASSSAAGVMAERTVQVDTTLATVSDITIDYILDDVGAVTGKVFNGGATDDTTVSVHGSLNAPLKDGQSVYFVLGKDTVADKHDDVNGYEAIVNGTSWSVDVPKELLNGVYSMGAWVQVPGDGKPLIVDGDTVDTWGRGSGGQYTDNFFITVDAGGPAITINTLAGDDLINAAEHSQALTVSGTTTGLAGGESVDVTLNGKSYKATVASNGNWSVNVLAGDVSALANGSQKVTASVRDTIGNVANTERSVLVDTTPPAASIRITGISDDTGTAGDFITSDTTLTIHGSLGNTLYAGNRVQVSVDGGKTWDFATVNKTTWSYVVPKALSEGQHEIQARTIETKTGNVGNMDSQIVTVDASAPTITINTLAGDGVINAAEHNQALAVSGTTTGLAGGESVGVTLNGKSYQATVASNGNWSVNVSAGDIASLANGSQKVTASVRDSIGNVANTERSVLVDTTPPSASINITGISDDTGIAGNFVTSDTTLTIHGSLGNTLYAGNRVQVSDDGGKTWDFATVNGTNWSYVIPNALPEGQHHIQARTIETKTGNVGNMDSQVVTIDANADAQKVTNSEDFEEYGYNPDTGTARPYDYGVAAGESYTFDSGMKITGIKNGAIANDPAISAFGTMLSKGDVLVLGGGGIGEISFGHQVENISFEYEAVNYAAYVEAYDSNGVLLDRTKLEGVDGSGGEGISNYSYDAFDGALVDHLRLDLSGERWGIYMDNFEWSYYSNVSHVSQVEMLGEEQNSFNVLSAFSSHENAIAGTASDDRLESTQANDHFTIGNGGNDTLTYRLLDATDATGGNGADRVSGFTVGKADTTSDADRIDLRELLADSGYQGSADGKVDLNALGDYLKVSVKGSDTEIAIDRDGAAGSAHEMTTLVTLSGVQTDLATLLANHQLVVS